MQQCINPKSLPIAATYEPFYCMALMKNKSNQVDPAFHNVKILIGHFYRWGLLMT